MKKTIFALIGILIIAGALWYYAGPVVSTEETAVQAEQSSPDTTGNITTDIESIDVGSLDADLESIDADINTL